jgi:UDP-N-acetylmuramyl tripeptide synthase
MPGTYNLYNALAAVSAADGLGLDLPKVVDTLQQAVPAFGRVERVELEGRTLYLLLIKNPAGFTQVLETFLLGRADVPVLMAINDLDADGRDVSWLWDVPLEAMAPYQPRIVAAGTRAADMALRLKYAGMTAEAGGSLERAVRKLVESTPAGGTAYVLPTYTAMLEVRNALSKLTHIPEAGR